MRRGVVRALQTGRVAAAAGGGGAWTRVVQVPAASVEGGEGAAAQQQREAWEEQAYDRAFRQIPAAGATTSPSTSTSATTSSINSTPTPPGAPPAPLAERLLRMFLPEGYPHTVGDTYMPYARMQAAASVASAAGGVLATQSLFYAAGLGATEAAPLAAALNWIMKDGIGQLGGVLFASAVNNRFDTDPKKWRMLSALALDLSCALEMTTPLFPGLFLPIASVATMGKNVSFLSASATRATMNNSFAEHSNLADVTAKAGSQTIAASTIGTSLGVLMAFLIGPQWSGIAAAFAVCSALHLFCLHSSLSHVVLRTLSVARLLAVLQDRGALTDALAPPATRTTTNNNNNTSTLAKHQLLTPAELAQREPSPAAAFLQTMARRRQGRRVSSPPELPDIVTGRPIAYVFDNAEHLEATRRIFSNERFVVVVSRRTGRHTPVPLRARPHANFVVHVMFEEAANPDDLLRGFAVASATRNAMRWFSETPRRSAEPQDNHETQSLNAAAHAPQQEQEQHRLLQLVEQAYEGSELGAVVDEIAASDWIVEPLLLEAGGALRYRLDSASS